MRALALLAMAASVASADDFIQSTYKGTQGLHELAKKAGKYMGTATDRNPGDTFYTKALENSADWGFLTPGNAMKWDSTEYSQNSFQWANGDATVALAKSFNAKLRCHTLTWHSQTPQWVQSLGKAEMLKALENHITQVMTHFGANCTHWDVLNEALNEDGTYRQSFWYKTTGTEYITTAFKTASAVKAKLGLPSLLFYNDYNTDHVNAKSTGVINNIVNLLQKEKIEINGVGFQAHLTAGQVGSVADQVKNMKRFTDLGLKVAITELDIKVGSSNPTAAAQKQQATDYQNTIAACKELEGCLGVTVWDFSDQYSWIKNDSPLPLYQPGGRNSKVVRKAAYDAIVNGWGGSETGGDSGSPSDSGSNSGSSPTTSPTSSPSSSPSTSPTSSPTASPSTSSPTTSPTTSPPAAPSTAPTTTPSSKPTSSPLSGKKCPSKRKTALR